MRFFVSNIAVAMTTLFRYCAKHVTLRPNCCRNGVCSACIDAWARVSASPVHRSILSIELGRGRANSDGRFTRQLAAARAFSQALWIPSNPVKSPRLLLHLATKSIKYPPDYWKETLSSLVSSVSLQQSQPLSCHYLAQNIC